MPAVDMSVSELEQYQGRNPRPVDFDEYWESAVAEMKAVKPKITLEKASFQAPAAKCYDMYFTGVNGARIYVKHLRPNNLAGKVPAMLKFHGYGESSENWVNLLGYAASGITVFAMDVRGQNGRSEDVGGVKGNTLQGHLIRGLIEENPHKMLYRDIYLDAAQLAGIVLDMDFVDEHRVSVQGCSQGAALSMACAALEPRIAKAALVSPFLCDFLRVWEMDLGRHVYGELKDYFRNFDPQHEHEDALFAKLGYIDLQHLASRIKAHVIMLTGLMDDICPPSTQYAAYNRMTCQKEHLLYPDYGHEVFRGMEEIIFRFLEKW